MAGVLCRRRRATTSLTLLRRENPGAMKVGQDWFEFTFICEAVQAHCCVHEDRFTELSHTTQVNSFQKVLKTSHLCCDSVKPRTRHLH